jgi:hypothetical protein
MKQILLLFLFSGWIQAQQLTEMMINPPGTDFPNEYIEVKFSANTTLTKYAVWVIEGDAANKGTLDNSYDLAGVATGASGYVLIASAGHPYGTPTGTTVLTPITSAASLENGGSTFLLVTYTDPLPATGTDLDTNEDGTLELPAGVSIVDSAALKDGATNLVYSSNVFDSTTLGYTPDLFVRAPNRWAVADLLGTAPNFTIDGTKSTRTDLGGQGITPGATNPVSTANSNEQPQTFSAGVFPNPFQSYLQVDAQVLVDKIELYNLLGQKVLESQQPVLATQNLAKGVYFVKVYSGTHIYLQQLIKQ